MDHNLYVGCTRDLKKRLTFHNAGKVASTLDRKPLALIHYEAFIDQRDAFAREQWLKSGWGRNHLQKTLRHTLKIQAGK